MAEGNFGEIEKSLFLSSIRDKYGQPSNTEINTVLKGMDPLFKSILAEDIFKDKDKAIGVFRKNREAYPERSKPNLCVKLLQKIIDHICIDRLEFAHKNGQGAKFRYFFDFKTGADLTLASISIAENEISGAGEKNTAEIAGKTPTTDKQIESYLELRKTDAQYSELLQKNPSGFLLVDLVVDAIAKKSDKYTDPGLINFRVGIIHRFSC